MKYLLQIVALISLLTASSSKWVYEANNSYTSCGNDSTCPTWFTCNAEKKCECDKRLTDAVLCDNENTISAVLDCRCVTYDTQSESTFAGSCFYNCKDTLHERQHDLFQRLPSKPEMLVNLSACLHFHQTGLLCGDCKEGYSPLVLSYNLSCVECPDGHRNWWKFIVAGFVPLTLFYIFIVIFKINITSSRLHGIVIYSQVISMPAIVRASLFVLSIDFPTTMEVVKVIVAIYSPWNLNLLRSALPEICLNVSTLQALALDYLIALYPFVLLLMTYFIIKVHDTKHTFIMIIWKPFHKILAMVDKSLNIRTSVFDAFTTFFLLSYVKIVSVTADILIPTQIYKLGSNSTTFGVYYSPSIRYFGQSHLPYAVLALTILTLFVCIPIAIFILYPFQFFQKFLSLIRNNWHFLHAFVDSFQGCYKDGTEPGTLDYRWFSAIILLLHPFLFCIYALTLSGMYFTYAAILIACFVIAIINIQPHKVLSTFFSSANLILLLLLALFFVSLNGRTLVYTEKYTNSYHTTFTGLALFSVLVPLLYIVHFILSWFTARISFSYRSRILTFRDMCHFISSKLMPKK